MADGELEFGAGFGVEDLVTRRPISINSRFDIASEAKQFTAACVVMLEQEGRIGLENEIGELLPELPEAFRRVRVRQLLHHTSGVRDFFETLQERGLVDKPLVLKDVFQVICEMRKPDFLPEEHFAYSNSGYALLAVIVERLEGKAFGTVVRERIFTPLEMKDSFVHDRPGATYERHAKGHLFEEAAGYRECSYPLHAVGGAGCLYSTVRDLSRWMDAFHSGKFGGQTFLKRMMTPARLKYGTECKYGFGLDWGLFFDAVPGVPIVTHSGGHGGSRSILLHAPQHRFSILLLCNNRRIDHGRIALKMAVDLARSRERS